MIRHVPGNIRYYMKVSLDHRRCCKLLNSHDKLHIRCRQSIQLDMYSSKYQPDQATNSNPRCTQCNPYQVNRSNLYNKDHKVDNYCSKHLPTNRTHNQSLMIHSDNIRHWNNRLNMYLLIKHIQDCTQYKFLDHHKHCNYLHKSGYL